MKYKIAMIYLSIFLFTESAIFAYLDVLGYPPLICFVGFFVGGCGGALAWTYREQRSF